MNNLENKTDLVQANEGGDFWGRLNAAYNTSEIVGDFQADFYWPTKDRRLPESDLVVEIVGAKAYQQGDQPKLHFHLRIPALGKTAIKSCRLLPESMRFLKMDMERLGIRVDDIRKLGPEIKKLFNQPIQARLYYNERSGYQDLDFVGLAGPVAQAEMPPMHEPNLVTAVKLDFGN
jgi:hypothetical protein